MTCEQCQRIGPGAAAWRVRKAYNIDQTITWLNGQLPSPSDTIHANTWGLNRHLVVVIYS